jgi:Na+:H+ antiporter, NhaA family
VALGNLEIRKPLLLWLNDGGMALFFLLVGLEIKRELLEGELTDRHAAMLPMIAAIGGMVVPAPVYAGINWGDAAAMRGATAPQESGRHQRGGGLSQRRRSISSSGIGSFTNHRTSRRPPVKNGLPSAM